MGIFIKLYLQLIILNFNPSSWITSPLLILFNSIYQLELRGTQSGILMEFSPRWLKSLHLAVFLSCLSILDLIIRLRAVLEKKSSYSIHYYFSRMVRRIRKSKYKCDSMILIRMAINLFRAASSYGYQGIYYNTCGFTRR